jgi:hypothetical protein
MVAAVICCMCSRAPPPFSPDTSYSKFAAFAVLHHGANFVAAAQDLAARGNRAAAKATSSSAATVDRESTRAAIDVQPVLVALKDVQPETVTWLWPGRLAAGKLALLVGDPGLGKSWTTLDLAARLSAGRLMPDGASAVPPGDVILLSAEDGLADTIRPRLDALGADVARIHHLARAKQWKKELRAEPEFARLVLRRLVGPLTLWDESERPDWIRFETTPTTELLSGLAPTRLSASPTGFEPVFWP